MEFFYIPPVQKLLGGERDLFKSQAFSDVFISSQAASLDLLVRLDTNQLSFSLSLNRTCDYLSSDCCFLYPGGCQAVGRDHSDGAPSSDLLQLPRSRCSRDHVCVQWSKRRQDHQQSLPVLFRREKVIQLQSSLRNSFKSRVAEIW